MAEFMEHLSGALKEWLGADRLAELPDKIEQYAALWGLTVFDPYPNLSFHYVAPAVQSDGTSVVLKIGRPSGEFSSQIEALRFYGGEGVVRLLEADAEGGAVLMERLEPGRMLSEMVEQGRDGEATEIAAELLEKMWRPAPEQHSFIMLEDWAKGFERLRAHFGGGTGCLDARLVDRAERVFAELLGSVEENVVLHGDFHHFNILSRGSGSWCIIDPKGVVGERGFDLAAFMQNPSPQSLSTLQERFDILTSALSLNRERAWGYVFGQSVLSAWWCVEDEMNCWRETMECAECLTHLRVRG
jgi:streptomycin 6-kinase